jgi:transposase
VRRVDGNKADIVSVGQEWEEFSREELLALVRRQQQQLEELTALVIELRAENERLRRGGKRQAAPFSKGERQPAPKPPGRKPGEGRFTYRQPPTPDAVTEPPVSVPVTLPSCPACGGALHPERTDLAFVTDLPPPRPRVTPYRISVCRCLRCGKPVRGEHPAVAPDQHGATAHRLSSRVYAAAHTLHYALGVPVRKLPAVLLELTGVSLTQSALTQDALRRAAGSVGAEYQRLRGEISQALYIHTDDTGWRVGGESAFLMAFTTPEASVYQVRRRHRNEEVQEIIPASYGGVMCCDRGKSYDARALAGVRQQKCLAHLLHNLTDVLTAKTGTARRFASDLKKLLQEALSLWHGWQRGERAGFADQTQALTERITHHLRDRPLKDRDNERLLFEVGSQHDRGNLLRFLADPMIPPTNNAAERALRPAVIARKVSHCSKTDAGAEAHAAFSSVLATAAKAKEASLGEALRRLFQPPELQPLPP